MIKTYDEALKTLDDIRTYLAISRADDCVEELDKVARYFINEKHKENPTFKQCIKEWEERGFEDIENNKKSFSARNTRLNVDVYIDKRSKTIQISTCHYNYTQTITCDLHNLIHKTIKAMEVENDK